MEQPEIVIINLTRFGDLLQTQPLITALSEGGSRISLVCLENFSGAGQMLLGLDHLISFPGSRFLAGMDQDWRKALADLITWKEQLPFTENCRVINITPSLAARILSRLISPEQCRGFCLDSKGFGLYSTPWAAFLQASSKHRGCSPFNLVDLFYKIAHLHPSRNANQLKEPDPEQRGRIKSLLHQKRPKGCKGFIGFQMGASEEKRQWPVDSFSRLGDLLWEKHQLCPVLLGTASEEKLGERYAPLAGHPHVNLMGRTNIFELAATLQECKLLFTNDTGTMHLAAGLNVPLVAFFLATAQPWDTGPYLDKCLCLEPDMDCHPCGFHASCQRNRACRDAIDPQEVYPFVREYLRTGAWPVQKSSGLRAWVSSIPGQGFSSIRSLSGHDHSSRSAWITLQRDLFSQFLDQTAIHPPSFDHSVFPPEDRKHVLDTVTEVRGRMKLLMEQARAARDIPKHMERKVMHTWQKITDVFQESAIFPVLAQVWMQLTQDAARDLDSFGARVAEFDALMASLQTCFQKSSRHLETMAEP